MTQTLDHLKTYDGKTWSNTIRTQRVQPKKYFLPKNEAEIAEIIRAAEQEGVRVRAVGSGHSFSSCAITPDYMLDLRKLQEVTDKGVPEGENYPLVHVQAGTTIKELNKQLRKRKYSILNMGGIDHQTISGAISTGTHGTGLTIPAIHGSVRAIQLVGEGGSMIQLEPASSKLFKSGEMVGEFVVRHSDEQFQAALVSLGAMGIIYAYYLEVRHEYWLQEKKEIMPWPKVRKMLADKTLLQSARGVMIQINPYAGQNKNHPDEHSCLVVTHKTEDKPSHLTNLQAMRNLMSIIAANVPLLRRLFYWFLVIVLKVSKKHTPWLLENAIRAQRDRSYINRAEAVLHQGAEFAKERAYDCEVAFDIASNHYLDVVDKLLSQAGDLAAKGFYHTSPIGLRFVSASKAFASPDYKRAVCYIDTPMILRSSNHEEMLKTCLNLMVKEGGAPHWGKFNKPLFDSQVPLKDIYPGLEKWIEVVQAFSKGETFINDFVKRIMNGKEQRARELA